MSFRRAIILFLMLFSLYHTVHFGCELEENGLDFAELIEEREEILKTIAADIAKFLEVPYLPSNTGEYLQRTIGVLLKVISAENSWKERRNLGNIFENLAKHVLELRTIKTEDLYYYYPEMKLVAHDTFMAIIHMYVNDKNHHHTAKLNSLLKRLEEAQGNSRVLFAPRRAYHASLGLGLSTTSYKTVIMSPLYFTYSCSQRSWAPKLGVALGTGHNGYKLTDSFIEKNGHPELIVHPEHPYAGLQGQKKGRMTFNWEGSVLFLGGSINHNARYGTGGISLLPLGFSIGPEFTSDKELSIEHDTWKFYSLLEIDKNIWK